MGAVKYYDIFCDADDCGTWDPNCTSKTARRARKLAYRLGWRRRRVGPREKLQDFCPRCVVRLFPSPVTTKPKDEVPHA